MLLYLLLNKMNNDNDSDISLIENGDWLNCTLDESIWKDSFDKIIPDKTLLKRKRLIKRNINASFNRNSSYESDSSDKEWKNDSNNKLINPEVSDSCESFKHTNSLIVNDQKGQLYKKESVLDSLIELHDTSQIQKKNSSLDILIVNDSRKSNASYNVKSSFDSDCFIDSKYVQNYSKITNTSTGKNKQYDNSIKNSDVIDKVHLNEKENTNSVFSTKSMGCYSTPFRDNLKKKFLLCKISPISSPTRQPEFNISSSMTTRSRTDSAIISGDNQISSDINTSPCTINLFRRSKDRYLITQNKKLSKENKIMKRKFKKQLWAEKKYQQFLEDKLSNKSTSASPTVIKNTPQNISEITSIDISANKKSDQISKIMPNNKRTYQNKDITNKVKNKNNMICEISSLNNSKLLMDVINVSSQDSDISTTDRIQRFVNKGSPSYIEPKIVLTPGKWRRSILHCRRTITQQGSNDKLIVNNVTKRKQSSQHLTMKHRQTFGRLTNLIHDISNNDCDAKELVLQKCNQSDPVDFNTVYSKRILSNCQKIGEGVYGEVFMNINTNGQIDVLKIIPIEGSLIINGEPQKKFNEILPEVLISMELSDLRNGTDFVTTGFVEVKCIRCVRGKYPNHLVKHWELYAKKKTSENDHPNIFPDDQIFIVIELANAGVDMEAFEFANSTQALSAFEQISFSLAVAEQKFKFEHRDLHWGNILLAPTEEETITYKMNGKTTKIPTNGIKAIIIDYTLSRLVLDGQTLFNDLSVDYDLFSASGDYQFEIYRLMKNELENNWNQFKPKTNVFWLDYIIDKFISGVNYKLPKSKKHHTGLKNLKYIHKDLLKYESCKAVCENLC